MRNSATTKAELTIPTWGARRKNKAVRSLWPSPHHHHSTFGVTKKKGKVPGRQLCMNTQDSVSYTFTLLTSRAAKPVGNTGAGFHRSHK